MKKLLLILALAVGLVFTGQACVTAQQNTGIEVNKYRQIEFQNENGETLGVIVPQDWPNFFVHPYEFEISMPLTPTYNIMALRHKNIFKDIYIVGIVFEKDHFIVVNIRRAIDDTYWVYMHFGPGERKDVRPHKVTKEEFFKNVEHWGDKTKEVY